MGKIKLTKGELKRQRDALKQYERYLPTLQLKKQQLQLEIVRQLSAMDEKVRQEEARRKSIAPWAKIFSDGGGEIGAMIKLSRVATTQRNIAGVDIAVFAGAEFRVLEYDLFLSAPWMDKAIDVLQSLLSLRQEIDVLHRGVATLKKELRTTTQRVNLFEKVKIPEAQEAIRLIKIYIGDQMANAVGRSKIAKRKIEEMELVAA